MHGDRGGTQCSPHLFTLRCSHRFSVRRGYGAVLIRRVCLINKTHFHKRVVAIDEKTGPGRDSALVASGEGGCVRKMFVYCTWYEHCLNTHPVLDEQPRRRCKVHHVAIRHARKFQPHAVTHRTGVSHVIQPASHWGCVWVFPMST